MDATKRPTSSCRQLPWVTGLLSLGAALFIQWGCDDFFGMEGHLYQCGTKVPIAGANGIADPGGRVRKEFTTDSHGYFSFVLVPVGPPSTVIVRFVKEGFVPFSQRFDGEPANADEIELCMEPVPQP